MNSSTEQKHHPRGKRERGSCEFLECTEKATEQRRVTRPLGWPRMMIHVCAAHANALDSGAPVMVEFVKG